VYGSKIYASGVGLGIIRASLTPSTQTSSCLTTVTELDGTFRSRTNSMGTYDNNLDCRWLIKPTDTSVGRIILTFSRFTTEQNFDFVNIYDGETLASPLLTRLSGSISTTVVARSGSMLLRFKTDSNTTASGWTATYSTLPKVTESFAPPTPLSPNGSSNESANISPLYRLNADANAGDIVRTQISTDSTFRTIAQERIDNYFSFVSAQSSRNTNFYSLSLNTRYFWRVLHTADTALAPRWSATASFTTAPASVQ
jgi:CUB domain